MAKRLTDSVTDAIDSIAKAIRTYTRASQGLPMTMVRALAVPVNTTQSVTITAATDVWVNGVFTNITTAAGLYLFDAQVTRMEISGFLIYENQSTGVTAWFKDAVGGKAGYDHPLNYKGFANPFVLRQGDILTVTFQNGPTAAAQCSVLVDAYRCTRLSPG